MAETTGTDGPLQTALSSMNELRKLADEPYSAISPAECDLINALHAVLTALIPAAQITVEHGERITATNSDVQTLADRIDEIRCERSALTATLASHRQRMEATDRDVGILAERLQAAERRIDGVELTLGWQRSTGCPTLHERLSVLEQRRIEGERIFADLRAERHQEIALSKIPITPEYVAGARGEDLDRVAERLGLIRIDPIGAAIETDVDLRRRCVTALFARALTRQAATYIAKHAAIARRGEADAPSYLWGARSPGWKPHEWVIDAIMAAAGANQGDHADDSDADDSDRIAFGAVDTDRIAFGAVDTSEAETKIAAKDRTELAAALDRIKELESQRADLENERDLGEWRAQLRKQFDDEIARQSKVHESAMQQQFKRCADLEAQRARLLETSNRDMEALSKELGSLREAHTERKARLDHALAHRGKLEAVGADQAIQIMELRAEIRRLVAAGSATELRGVVERAQPLMDAVREWRRVAPMPHEAVAVRMHHGEAFHVYEIPLVDAFDAWERAVRDAHDGTNPARSE